MKKGTDNKKIIVAYVPVLHEGYLRFFNKHRYAKELFLIGTDISKNYKQLTKDLRAIDPLLMKKAIDSLGIFKEVKVIGEADLKKIDGISLKNAEIKREGSIKGGSNVEFIMPDEDVMQNLADKYLLNAKVNFDSIFLRWDKHKSFDGQPVDADQEVSIKDFDKKLIKELKVEAEKSSDWWRHIGAAVVKGGIVIMKTHNHAVPNEQMPYVEGDPRADFSKGINVELSTSFHCEAKLIAEAARVGISLEGASMYATTFPCPPCAKLIAYSGIKEIFYADGYGVLDGERILKSRGVKIIFVKTGK